MKNVVQVLEAIDTEQPVTEEELRLACKCLSLYAIQARQRIDTASQTVTPGLMARALDPQFDARMYRACLSNDMKTFLTPRYTPGTEEFKASRAQAQALFDAAEAGKKKETAP